MDGALQTPNIITFQLVPVGSFPLEAQCSSAFTQNVETLSSPPVSPVGTPVEALSELKAYDKRNVYKSIIRHMSKFTHKYHLHFTATLKREGFLTEEIETAFNKVTSWAEQEKHKGKPKASKKAIEEMLMVKNIYTYMLRETLHFMIQSWQDGRKNRILKKNVEIYKDVCEEYYGRVSELINNQNACFTLL
eukprot:TRINITY_DN7907_c0_g1_i16.p1 TRINITY_DN7907_c0_g1~~TRINITY_DN7907_c0_g1_i16.p1  ORF type:complete len:191 (+),score=43.31 TRINITY_DN7907_c0_g1_i16:314-886(+)